MHKNIFFDLDGTLVDSQEGILKSMHHVFTELNTPIPSNEKILSYVGTPLRDIFAGLCSTNDTKILDQAVKLYTTRYAEKGVFENRVYDGIELLLRKLKVKNKNLFVATSKSRIYAVEIIKILNLAKYFTEIYGSEPDEKHHNKTELIQYALQKSRVSASESIMIGDRKYDIIGARDNGMTSIAIGYGYGTLTEIQAANPDYFCATIPELEQQLFTRH